MLKRTLKTILHTLGYELVKVPDANDSESRQPLKYPVTEIEIKNLRKDLDVFFAHVNGPYSTDHSWTGYDTIEMLGYLSNERLSFYHELIGLCRARTLSFDRKTIADIGTYLGYLPRLILESASDCRVIGMDLDERSLGLARHLCPACEFVVFDPMCNPGPYAGRFDIVFCTEVLEHVNDPEHSLSSLMRLLAPDGTLILTVPNGRTDLGGAGEKRDDESYTGHINFWSPESWANVLRKNVSGTCETGVMSSGENFAVIRGSAASDHFR